MKKTGKFLAIAFMILMAAACQYDFIAPEEATPVEPGVEVSFATQVLPIFTANNNCSSCHKTGGTSPDLSASNAYNSINNTKYLNKTSPAESVIYKVLLPGSTSHSHKTYTTTQAAMILAWIQQGAKNN